MSSPLDNAGQIYSTVLPQVHDDTGEVNLEAEALTLRKGFTPFYTNPEPFTNPVPSKNPDISINLVPTVNPFNPIHTVDNLLERATQELEYELMQLTLSGATTPALARTKKVTVM